jgi:hypothetical protein
MECDQVKAGLRVKTTELGNTIGILVKPQYLDARREGVVGVDQSHVPGHGGDVWWVEHEDTRVVAAYVFTEFDPA